MSGWLSWYNSPIDDRPKDLKRLCFHPVIYDIAGDACLTTAALSKTTYVQRLSYHPTHQLSVEPRLVHISRLCGLFTLILSPPIAPGTC